MISTVNIDNVVKQAVITVQYNGMLIDLRNSDAEYEPIIIAIAVSKAAVWDTLPSVSMSSSKRTAKNSINIF